MPKSTSYDSREKDVSYHGLDGKRQTKATRDTGVDGLHWDNLWDENEDRAGQQRDESTGESIDNSTFTDETGVLRAGGYIVELTDTGEKVVLEPWEEEDRTADELADAWLAANDASLPADGHSDDQVA